MAIDAGDLSLAIRVMIGQTSLCPLGLVALQAGFVGLRAWLDRYAAFGTDLLDHSRASAGRGVQGPGSFRGGLKGLRMYLMAIGAADVVHVVRTVGPMPYLRILGMASETDAVGIRRRPLMETDDLALVAAAINVKAAVTVAVFALQPLLGVIRVAKSCGVLRVTVSAGVCADSRRAGDLYIFSVGLNPIC